MRRAVARGRVFPQSYSIDRRYGRLSLKAVALFPLIWVNADDQGRLCGDPEEIKYSCCPNIDHIIKADVPKIIQELEDNKLIRCYDTPKSPAIQILDWWDPHRSPQWAWPSDYQPPEGWQDHLRFKKDAKTVITLNWPVSGEDTNSSQVSTDNPSGERSGEVENDIQVNSQVKTENRSGEKPANNLPFPRTPIPNLNNGKGKGGGRGRGRGNSPEPSKGSQVSTSQSRQLSGKHPHPRRLVLTVKDKGIYEILKENYRTRWGRVEAKNPREVIPRVIGAKDGAQLRDLAIELSDLGGCQPDMIKQAFDEAAGQEKLSISYLRAVLFAWLGVEKTQRKVPG